MGDPVVRFPDWPAAIPDDDPPSPRDPPTYLPIRAGRGPRRPAPSGGTSPATGCRAEETKGPGRFLAFVATVPAIAVASDSERNNQRLASQ